MAYTKPVALTHGVHHLALTTEDIKMTANFTKRARHVLGACHAGAGALIFEVES